MDWWVSLEDEKVEVGAVKNVPINEGAEDEIILDMAPAEDAPVKAHSQVSWAGIYAEIIPFYDPGKFRMQYSVTNDKDETFTVTALLKLPLPEDMSGWRIRYLKKKSGLNFYIDFEDKTFVIKTPNPEEIWEQIQELGGVLVDNEQFVKVETDDYDHEILLEVTTVDDYGTYTVVTACGLGSLLG